MKKFLFLLCLFLFLSCEAKVYDCFLFFNELDILELRLHELGEVVDHFVLVESNETFRGNSKPFYFEENQERFAPFRDKIIRVALDKHIEGDAWAREKAQRNAIAEGLVGCEPEDVVLISDVDEIIRASKIGEIRHALKSHRSLRLHQPMYRFYLNAFDFIWHLPRAVSYQYLQQTTPNALRQEEHHPFVTGNIFDCGWHFTSIGGLQLHRIKTEAYSHAENDNEAYKSQGAVDAWVQKCRIVPIDETFPAYLREHLGDYDRFLYKPGQKYE